MKKFLILLSLFATQIAVAQSDTASISLVNRYRAMALTYNDDLKSAKKNIEASIELTKAARADRGPKLSADADFSYTGNPIELSLTMPGVASPVDLRGTNMKYGISLTLLQPVYAGGRVLESIRMAESRQMMAVSQTELIRSLVSYQTDIQYWNTVARAEVRGVADDFRSSVANLTRIVSERVEAGMSDRQELLTAEVKLNEADATTYMLKLLDIISLLDYLERIGFILLVDKQNDEPSNAMYDKEKFEKVDEKYKSKTAIIATVLGEECEFYELIRTTNHQNLYGGFYQLLKEYSSKYVYPTGSLMQYVKAGFKEQEQINFQNQQKLGQVGIVVAIAIGVFGIANSFMSVQWSSLTPVVSVQCGENKRALESQTEKLVFKSDCCEIAPAFEVVVHSSCNSELFNSIKSPDTIVMKPAK